MLAGTLSAVVRYRGLIWLLARKQLAGQYRKSVVRSLWLVLFPLFNVIMWLILHHAGLFSPGDTGVPYPAYILISMALWYMFIGSYKALTTVLVQNSKLFLQIRFPAEVIVTKQIIVHLINFCIPFILALAVALGYGVNFSLVGIILFPFLVLPLLLLGVTIGLLFSVLRIVAIDIYNLFDRIMDLLLYLTPVVYALHVNNSLLQTLISWNPLTYLLSSVREMLLFGAIVNPQAYAVCSGATLILFIVSVRFFQIAQPRTLEKLAV